MAKGWQVPASRPDNAEDLPPGCGKPNIADQGLMIKDKGSMIKIKDPPPGCGKPDISY